MSYKLTAGNIASTAYFFAVLCLAVQCSLSLSDTSYNSVVSAFTDSVILPVGSLSLLPASLVLNPASYSVTQVHTFSYSLSICFYHYVNELELTFLDMIGN